MKISVIIPTFNEEDVIGKCLESLFNQTHKDFEVIVVDDGSTDKTLEVLQNFQFSSTNFQILQQEHKGPGSARNLGAEKARGEILVFVDADMTFDKDFLLKLVKPIEEGRAKGTNSSEEYVSNWGNVWARCWNYNQGLRFSRRGLENAANDKVFRAILKSEFERVGGFDLGGHYTDDWSLSEKLGYLAVATNARFYHQNPGSLAEVYKQAFWAGKRPYKLGVFGTLIALLRTTLPVSIVMGAIKSIFYLSPTFLVFKIVYDTGRFVGILHFWLFGKGAK